MTKQSIARREELLARLERGFQDMQKSDRFLQWLDTCSRFHKYSAQNSLLIMLQQPNASRVAGFNTWKSLGRCVRKGERGIAILAPCSFRKVERQADDDDEEREDVQQPVAFRTVYVFDVSQTDGEPLPTITDEPAGDDDAGLFSRLSNVAIKEKLWIDRTPGRGNGANGFYSKSAQQIWIKPDAGLAMATKTLAHELAHHFAQHDTNGHCRSEGETIAEAAAYIVLNHHGLEADGYSFGYLASWTDTKTFKAKLGEIQKVANTIIERCETAHAA